MRHLLIGCTLLCSLAVCACSEKPYSEAVETFNEEMSGPYILHLAHWLGAGVFSGLNLNGDSGTGDDICQELIDYPNVSNLGLSLAGFVESPDSDGSGEIWLRIPLQDMAMDKEHNYTLLGAVTPAVGFKYNIDVSGEITIGSEVDYSELDNSRVLSDGSWGVTEKSLTELETELNPDEFFRVNRQTIANIDHIRKISPTDGRDSAVSLTVPWSDLSFVITAERKKELLRILDC